MNTYDYGENGVFGIITPQANPTVETEMRYMMPGNSMFCTARCTSHENQPEDRLIEYIEQIEKTLTRFDSLQFDALGFACTASSYLVGKDREKNLLNDASKMMGAPVISATMAIELVLSDLQAKTISLLAPYPSKIVDAASQYWSDAGYTIKDIKRIETSTSDTRSIYSLGSDDAATHLKELSDNVDCVLITGTGMPTLPLYSNEFNGTICSSNPSLAWSLFKHSRKDFISFQSFIKLGQDRFKLLQTGDKNS